MMLIDPYRWGVRGPASVEFIGISDITASVGNTTTYPAMNVGDDAPRRRIFVAMHWYYGTTPILPTALTVNGYVAEMHIISDVARPAINPFYRCAIYSAEVQTGSSVSVVVDWNGNSPYSQCGVYRGDNIFSGNPVAVGKDRIEDTGTHLTVDLTTQADGVLVACGNAITPATWIGATEQYEEAFGYYFLGASDDTPSNGTRTVAYDAVFSPGLDFSYVLIAASFR